MKVKLGKYVYIQTGKLDANAAVENGEYPFFTCSAIPLAINSYNYKIEFHKKQVCLLNLLAKSQLCDKMKVAT